MLAVEFFLQAVLIKKNACEKKSAGPTQQPPMKINFY
jgi:hypothetical protein